MSIDSISSSSECPHKEDEFALNYRHRYYYIVSVQTCQEHSETCSQCRLLLQAVEVFKPGWINDHKNDKDLFVLPHPERPFTVYLEDKSQDSFASAEVDTSMPETEQKFHIFRRSQVESFYENGQNWSGDLKLPATLRDAQYQSMEITENSSSQAALNRAAKWLSYCLEHDRACNLTESAFMPCHLIDIGSWDGSREPFLFKPSQPAPYACLSYCWGSDTNGILTTTTSNIRSHYKSIPFSNMPRGIQDAVSVCRGLKIPNLWVDSLCIVQDDPVAWLQDAKEMDQIYLHSLLTIAALEPASCKLPFLGPQRYGHPEFQYRLVTDISPKKDEAPVDVFIRNPYIDENEFQKRFSLDKRGWCLQETVLPNRRLSFSGDEMIWECLCRKVCECGHVLWVPPTSDYSKLGVPLKQTLLKAEIKSSKPLPAVDSLSSVGREYLYAEPNDLGEGYPSEAHRRWRHLVMDYSRRSVSRRQDKLDAVSGLANMASKSIQQEVHDQSNYGKLPEPDKNIAGLWKRELHFDLAWEVKHISTREALEATFPTGNTEEKLRIVAGRDRDFPSWSWASVDQPIHYSFDWAPQTWHLSPFLSNCVKVEDVSYTTDLRNGEISAPICDNRAVLTGDMVDVEVEVESTPGYHGQMGVRRPYNGCTNEVILDRPGSVRRGDHLCCFRLFSWEAFTRLDDDGKLHRMSPESWYLVLRRLPVSDELAVAGELFERVGLGSERAQGGSGYLFDDCSMATVNIV